jgi:hypothetical protein
MVAIKVGSEHWDCTPEFFLERLAKEKLPSPDDAKPKPVVMSTQDGDLPPTYFFQTREGAKASCKSPALTQKNRA